MRLFFYTLTCFSTSWKVNIAFVFQGTGPIFNKNNLNFSPKYLRKQILTYIFVSKYLRIN